MVTNGRVYDLTRRIRELHPDEAAEIVALPVVAGNHQYFDWLLTRSW